MPQMKPHYWFFLLIIMTMMLMTLLSLTYFTWFLPINTLLKTSNSKLSKNSWTWKW